MIQVLRGIRVASKQDLSDRIHLYFMAINADPVIFRWKCKMSDPRIAYYQQNHDRGGPPNPRGARCGALPSA